MSSKDAISGDIGGDRILALQILRIWDFLRWQDKKIMQIKYIFYKPEMPQQQKEGKNYLILMWFFSYTNK